MEKTVKSSTCGGCGTVAESDSSTAAAHQAPIHDKASTPVSNGADAFTRTVDDVLIWRAQALKGYPGNPFGVHFKEHENHVGVLTTAAPTPALNRVLNVELRDTSTVALFNEWFRASGAVPAYQVFAPVGRPPTTIQGFVKVTDWDHVLMKKENLDATAHEPAPAKAVTVTIASKDDAEPFTRVYAEAFNYPSKIAAPLCKSIEGLIGHRHVISYVAWLEGRAVSVGQLFLGRHGVAYLGSTGTIPAARGLGCQAILDQIRVKDAVKAGYSALCRQVSLLSQSWRNAVKIDFKAHYREELFAPLAGIAARRSEVKHGTDKDKCCSVEMRKT